MRAVLLILVFCLLPFAAVTADEGDITDYARGVSTVTNYFDLLVSGNLESAGYLWRQDVVERAQRFGIEYTGIPLKVDCNSPVVRQLDFMQDHLQSPIKQVLTLDDPSFLRMEFNAIIKGQVYRHYYYAQWMGEYAWLIHAQDYFARDWPVVESKFFRVHVHPNVQQYLTPAALAEADAFIERMSDRLDLSKDLKNDLAEKKIEYFYCDSDLTVEQIIGHRVQGTFDLPTNDVISATFPHFHEITHLLVNARLKTIPLFTLPLFREGVAVHYGGRWGKGPHALTDLGIFMHRQEIVPFDSILTMYDFSNYSGADIAYPVAGVFTGYLVDRYGQDRYFDIYRSFSAPFEKLNAMPAEEIQSKLAALIDKPNWSAVMTEFNGYLDTYAAMHAVAKPGSIEHAKPLLAGEEFSVEQNDDWLVFVFLSAPQDTVAGTFLWGDIGKHEGKLSSLFIDQFQDERTFEGHHYAVRYDQFEVGLYDYASNQLLAKYIWGITPSETYFDETDGTVRVCFRKSLVTEMPTEETVAFYRP